VTAAKAIKARTISDHKFLVKFFPVDMKENLNSFICGEVGVGDGDDADSYDAPSPIYSAHHLRNSRCLILKCCRL
jgi:hypothetical protein